MIKFPLAHIVEVNVNRNGLHLFDIVSHDVGIPNRAEKDLVKRRIVCRDLDRGLAGVCLNINSAYHGSAVALIIADREFDVMNTVCKNNIGERYCAAVEGAGSFNTVDIGFDRRNIQARKIVLFRIVGNLGTKAENIFGNGLTVQNHCIRHTAGCICHIPEYRGFAVIDCVGIINGDIVHIHDITTVVGLVLIVIIIVSGTVTVGNIELNNVRVEQIQAFIFAQINGKIVPARFFVLIYKSRCRSNSVGKGICYGVIRSHILARVVQYQGIYRITDPCGNILVGDVNPHTEFGGIFKLFLAAFIFQCGHHISRFQRVAVVDVQRHGAVAAVNLTVCGSYGIYLAFGQYIVVWNITEIKHARVAVFKIEDDFGALAEFDCCRRSNFRAVEYSGNPAFGYTAVTGSEVKAFDGADSVIFKHKREVGCFDLDFVQTVSRRN